MAQKQDIRSASQAIPQLEIAEYWKLSTLILSIAEMEHIIQRKVVVFAKRNRDKMMEETGTASSLPEEDVKEYLELVINDVVKIQHTNNLHDFFILPFYDTPKHKHDILGRIVYTYPCQIYRILQHMHHKYQRIVYIS
jgi:hypothetical protein